MIRNPFQRPSAPEAAPAPVNEASVQEEEKAPANDLEKIVQEAPPVVAELKDTEARKREEALKTMGVLEAARADKGNFCITLGEGDSRAVLLSAPVEGRTWEGPRGSQKAIFTDYFILTRQGPRRVSFATESSWLKDDEIRKQQSDLSHLKAIIAEAQKGNPVRPNAYFKEYGTEHKEYELEINSVGTLSGQPLNEVKRRNYASSSDPTMEGSGLVSDVVDNAKVQEALSKSIEQAQSPVATQLENARNQIQTLQEIGHQVR